MYKDYNDIPGKKPKTNYIGKTFNELTVVAYTRKKRAKGLTGYWVCNCSCGAQVDILGNKLLTSTACHSCACSIAYRSKMGGKYIDIANYPMKIRIYKNYMRRATNIKKLDFTLTESEFFKLITDNCFYCNAEPKVIHTRDTLSRRDGEFCWNGVDRINSSKGYISDNVVTCCATCNKAKLDTELDDFYQWVERIYNFRVLKVQRLSRKGVHNKPMVVEKVTLLRENDIV